MLRPSSFGFWRCLRPPLLLALVAAGCREPLGPPEKFATTSVSGVVLEDGKAVGGGWIELIPVDGTTGDTRSAALDSEGRFRADRVAIGQVALRLVNAPIRMKPIAPVFERFSTPIRRKIVADHQESIRIELMDEYVRSRANQPQRPKLDPALEPRASDRDGGGAP